jgi:hypothetical protein
MRCGAEVKNKWSSTSSPPIYLNGVDGDSFYRFLTFMDVRPEIHVGAVG